jgi:hypothetical protein
MFRPHMGHHQATLIIGETTALYTLSSVPLGASLYFVVNFFRRIYPSYLFAGYFSLFKLFIFVAYALVLSSLVLLEGLLDHIVLYVSVCCSLIFWFSVWSFSYQRKAGD